ncbi:MAG: hypothetical protein LH632_13280 [Rhodoferax sp.]|nr:hypothetical protein [Rhodoferax sp.]
MSLYGHGAVTIWHDLLPQAKDAFYAWHNHEHMPERVGIPGFRRGRRYIAECGTPEYFNLYEADSPEVLSGQDYLNRLNAPTPWTQEVVVSFRNVTRAICRVLYSGGVGQAGHLLTLRFDLPPFAQQTASTLLRQRILPPLADAPGIVGVHLCRADDSGSRIETAEKKARNQETGIPRWILMIEGISAQAVEACCDQLLQRLADHSVPLQDRNQAVYRLEYQRCKHPWG